MIRASALFFIATLSALTSTPARSESNPVRLLASEKSDKKITHLMWSAGEPSIEIEKAEDKHQATATLSGTFGQRDSLLIWGDQKVAMEASDLDKRKFELRVALLGPRTSVHLFAIDPMGIVEHETAVIEVSDFNQRISAFEAEEASPYRGSISLGYSAISYQETLVSDFSQTALTAKASFSYQFAPTRWDVGVSAYMTALPLTTSLENVTLRFLGINLRAGYTLPWPGEPWTLSIMGGAYYTSTFVTDNSFGFTNMMGPQIFPVLRRKLGPKNSLAGYFKYSPILNGMSLSFASHELATGLSWSHVIRGRKSVSVMMDLARLSINIQDVFLIESSSVSLGLGFGW